MMSSQKDQTLKTNVMLRFGFWEANMYLQTYIASKEKVSFHFFPLSKSHLKSDAGAN